MKHAAAIALFYGALASGQTTTSPNHFQLPDKLTGPNAAQPPRYFASLLNAPRPLPAACAIPLLSALPANANKDYKIQVLRPRDNSIYGAPMDRMPVAKGLPPCPAKPSISPKPPQ